MRSIEKEPTQYQPNFSEGWRGGGGRDFSPKFQKGIKKINVGGT